MSFSWKTSERQVKMKFPDHIKYVLLATAYLEVTINIKMLLTRTAAGGSCV